VVAGQPAYQLLVSPIDAPGSTVGHVELDIAAQGDLAGAVLRVAVYARGDSNGQGSPELQFGYTGQLGITVPAPAVVSFHVPPGAKVYTHLLTAEWVNEKRKKYVSTVAGQGWDGVLVGSSASIAPPADEGELEAVTSPVRVGGEAARLFSTDLLNVLFMPNGQYYAGFVTPAALERAASEAQS